MPPFSVPRFVMMPQPSGLYCVYDHETGEVALFRGILLYGLTEVEAECLVSALMSGGEMPATENGNSSLYTAVLCCIAVALAALVMFMEWQTILD